MLSPLEGKMRSRNCTGRESFYKLKKRNLRFLSPSDSGRERAYISPPSTDDSDEDWLQRVVYRSLNAIPSDAISLRSDPPKTPLDLDQFECDECPLISRSGLRPDASGDLDAATGGGQRLDDSLLVEGLVKTPTMFPIASTPDLTSLMASMRLEHDDITLEPAAEGSGTIQERSDEKTAFSEAMSTALRIAFEPDAETAKEVFVSSICFGTTEAEVRELFSRCGEVLSVKLPLDGSRRTIRGIGFVSFAEESSVLFAIATLNGYKLNGRQIRVRRNRGKVPIGRKQALQRRRVDKQKLLASPPPSDSLTVFVGNLPFELSDDALKALIQKSGVRVVDCRVVTDSEGKSRGFGYVDLADAKSMRAAVERVSGMVVGGRVVRVDYSMSATKARKKGSAKRRHSGDSKRSSLKKAEGLEMDSLSAPPPTQRRPLLAMLSSSVGRATDRRHAADPMPDSTTALRTLSPLRDAASGHWQAGFQRLRGSHSAAFGSAFLRADDASRGRGHEYEHGHEVYGASAAATRPMSALSEYCSAEQMFHERVPTTAVPLQYGRGSEQRLPAVAATMSDPRYGAMLPARHRRFVVLADGRRLVWTQELGYFYTI